MEGQVKLGLSSSAHLKQQHPDHPWHPGHGEWLRKDKNPRNPPAPTHHLTPTWQTQPPTKVYGPVEQWGPDHSQRSSDPAAGAGVPSLGALLPGSPSPFGLSSVRKGWALISPWQVHAHGVTFPGTEPCPRPGSISVSCSLSPVANTRRPLLVAIPHLLLPSAKQTPTHSSGLPLPPFPVSPGHWETRGEICRIHHVLMLH